MVRALRAAAEPTRLRILALCSEAELSVTDLTQILGQSQPGVSRHLRLLCEAGLLDRSQEGAWAFFRLRRRGDVAALGELLVAQLGADDAGIVADRARLREIRDTRAAAAATYFRRNAAQWDRIRGLYTDEQEVEEALLQAFEGLTVADLLDVGTGTGRMLRLFADRAEHAVGIDLSHDMLTLARAALDAGGLRHCRVRYADMYRLPWAEPAFDAVTVHQVLHYAENPPAVLAEVARVLRPGGRLAVVDFAPHGVEFLRSEHAHRHLGFAEAEMADWMRTAGLSPGPVRHLPGQPLTVTVWVADRPAIVVPSERRALEAVR